MLRVGVGRRSSRHRIGSPLGPGFIKRLGPITWFRYGLGITIATGVSQWDDQSGFANHAKQASGPAQPALQSDNSILFDGAADFLATSAFTLNQPFTLYFLLKQVSWTAGNRFFGGNLAGSTICQQNNGSPNFNINAGSAGPTTSAGVIGTFNVISVVFNGASSSDKLNNGTPSTGNAGAGNAGGITLGSDGGGLGAWCNTQDKEVIVFPAAHDAPTQQRVIRYLAEVGQLQI